MSSDTKNKCVAKTQDEGNFSTTCIDMSQDGKYLATGSKIGAVNIFEFEPHGSQKLVAKPVKSVLNLTTSITDLKFHPSSQMLGICSKWKKNAVRLIHLPSFNTYQNFPGSAVGILKYGLNIEFNSEGSRMAMGNDEGKAHLWSLNSFN